VLRLSPDGALSIPDFNLPRALIDVKKKVLPSPDIKFDRLFHPLEGAAVSVL